MALNILQITFGLLTIPPCFFMLIEKEVTSSGGRLIDFIPQSSVSEVALVILGLAIITCGILQWKAHTRYAMLHVFLGLIISVSSAFIAVRLMQIAYFDIRTLHIMALMLLACGFGVITVGLIQLKASINKTDEQTNQLSETADVISD